MAGYARLSNDFWQDRDVLKLRRRNPSAALLYVMAISWCSDHASDGIIAEDELLYVLNASDEDVSDLAASGLLLRGSDEGCYVIRNYLKYQNSAEQIEQTKEKVKERQRRKRERDANKTVTDSDNESVTPMSRRDNESVTPMSFNQEPRTKNQKNSSDEEFSLPQTPSQAEGAAESADEDYPLGFEQFWETYPRKNGKRKAFEAWRKARRKTNNTFLISKAAQYAADPNREPGYTLTPANWLDGEHWDDDPLPAKPEPTARPSPSAKPRSQQNLEANMARTWQYMTPAERAEYQRTQGGNNAQQG
ncbi:hypothetical protein [Bifidobacterium bifidum]|uniref:hypothetical protein n=1 Tax=Bifidobacterium bifidum TaxID=1681 RepID=UPI0034A5446C